MSGLKSFTICLLCLWVAAGCQQGLAAHVEVFGAGPDFILATLVALGMLLSRRGAATLGFFGGLLHGAISGANLAAYTVTRTLTGFVIGAFGGMEIEANLLVIFLTGAIATVFAQLLLMFFAPPGAIVPFLLATIGSAMYNGVLAMPFYALLQRILSPVRR